MSKSETTTGRTRWLVVFLAFCAIFLDGLDTAAFPLTVPSLAKDWGVSPASFTVPLVATNLAVVLGYLVSGRLAASFGQRRIFLIGAAVFTVATPLTAAVFPLQSTEILTLARVIAGLGLGVVLPVGIAFATGYASARMEQAVSLIVAMGFVSGNSAAGFIGRDLIRSFGAQGFFWFASGISVIVVLTLVLFLPAEPQQQRKDTRQTERVRQLFLPGLRINTLLLWAFAFLVFVVYTTLLAWAPTFLTEFDFTVSDAALGIAFLGLGGVVGCACLVPITQFFGIGRAIVVMPIVGLACLGGAAFMDVGGTALLMFIAGVGAGVQASMTGQLGMAVAMYPPESRTTGIGLASALGRTGSLVGPGVAGILLALGGSAQGIMQLLIVPLALAVACAAILYVRTRRILPSDSQAETGAGTSAEVLRQM